MNDRVKNKRTDFLSTLIILENGGGVYGGVGFFEPLAKILPIDYATSSTALFKWKWKTTQNRIKSTHEKHEDQRNPHQ